MNKTRFGDSSSTEYVLDLVPKLSDDICDRHGQLKQKYWYMLHTILEARMKTLLKKQGREDFSGVQAEDLLAELRSVTRNTLHAKSMLDGTAETMADLVFDLGQQLVVVGHNSLKLKLARGVCRNRRDDLLGPGWGVRVH